MRKRLLFLATVATCSVMSLSAFAGEWKNDMHGKWYEHLDGSYTSNGWEQIEGKYYYFDEFGYILKNQYTPDGFYVDKDGVWIEDANVCGDSIFEGVVTAISSPGGLKEVDPIPIEVHYYKNVCSGKASVTFEIDRAGMLAGKISINDSLDNRPVILYCDAKITYSDGTHKGQEIKRTFYEDEYQGEGFEPYRIFVPSKTPISNIVVKVKENKNH